MMRRCFAPLLAAGLGLGGVALAAPPAELASSEGWLGHTDLAAAQRGFAVYQGVCASCHGMRALHYGDLQALGFSAGQTAGIAAAVKLQDGSAAGLDLPFKAPGAVAMGGALPPDLSTIAAQLPGGPGQIYAFLTSYAPAPAGVSLLPGHFYNSAIPGFQVAMPPVLRDGAVSYADGTSASAAQEAADVAVFLGWAADPNLTTRHIIGLRAAIFFAFLSIVALLVKRRVWRAAR